MKTTNRQEAVRSMTVAIQMLLNGRADIAVSHIDNARHCASKNVKGDLKKLQDEGAEWNKKALETL